jgi:hypothetical protein
MRGALRSDANVDANDYLVIDDDELGRLGGVTALDRLDVAHLRANEIARLRALRSEGDRPRVLRDAEALTTT